MISAYAFYRLGWVMRDFLPHVFVNDSVLLHTLGRFGEPPAYRVQSIQVTYGDEPVQLPALDLTDQTIPDTLREPVKQGLVTLRAECVKLKLKSSFASLDRLQQILDDPKSIVREMAAEAKALHERIIDDLRYTSCFVVEGSDEELYTGREHFGAAVAARFSVANEDIEEAAKCLALSRATACVFHLMRVLEIGLQALATDLGLASVEENWQKLLNDVRGVVNRLPRSTDAEKAHHVARSELLAHLQSIKDAWRNDVIHPRQTYTVEQAREIWDHSKAFMKKLAGAI